MVSSRRPFNSPLEDAGVLPAHWQKVTVIMCESNVGHMTAMALVLITWSLTEKSGNNLLMSCSINEHFYWHITKSKYVNYESAYNTYYCTHCIDKHTESNEIYGLILFPV